MVLRLIALLFGAVALLFVVAFGWSWPLGELLTKVNSNFLTSLQDFVRRVFWGGAWDSLFSPVFELPAWSAPAAIALLLVAIAAMRPGKG